MNTLPYNVGVSVLVDGKPVKQYFHNGKLFIEAKEGSEYEIKVTNDSYGRVLAVASVDGLNVLNGEAASKQDTGYVIDARDALRIKGFRYSDEKVAAFKFSKKDQSYASGKGDGAERNCGVISVAVTYEQAQLYSFLSTPIYSKSPVWRSPSPYEPTWTTCQADSSLAPDMAGQMRCSLSDATKDTVKYDAGAPEVRKMSFAPEQEKARGFDMGSTWGQAKESKVRTVDFERGSEAGTVEIYYASRESLLEMGIPLVKETQISFPQGFPNQKYATAPAGWRG